MEGTISSQSYWVPIWPHHLALYVNLCHQLNLPRELSSLPKNEGFTGTYLMQLFEDSMRSSIESIC